MKLFKLIGFISIAFMFMFTVNAAFNVCNVNIAEPWFVVKNSTSGDLIIIDEQGDMYVEGTPSSRYNAALLASEDAIQIGGLYFATTESFMKEVNENSINLNGVNGFIVKNAAGENVSFIDNLGIELKGTAIFNGSQSGCYPDGFYCSGNDLVNRNYFCEINGTRSGFCSYDVNTSENCLDRLSTDTDGGINNLTFGQVRDYDGCTDLGVDGLSDCDFTTYSDRCSDAKNLIEYFDDGTGVDSISIDCDANGVYYCDGLVRKKVVTGCTSGRCAITDSDFVVQTCNTAGSPTYSGVACTNTYPGTWRGTQTTYSNECANSGCWVSDVDTVATGSCAGTEYCSGGVCRTTTYYWSSGSWGSCSVSCGGGTKYRSVVCRRNFDNAVVSSSNCNAATKPSTSTSCNTGACCTPTTVMIYNGNGDCDDACSGAGGRYCSRAYRDNRGMDGARWTGYHSCSDRVRGWSGDCGRWGSSSSCGSGYSRVTSGSDRCTCSCP